MSITITIPLVGEELRQTAQMLLDLANLRASRDSAAAVVAESKPTAEDFAAAGAVPAPPVPVSSSAVPTPTAVPLNNPALSGSYSGLMAGAAPVPPAPPLSGPESVAPNYSGAQSGGYAPAPPVATPLTPPAPAASGPELDGEGLPWDKRIHASTKTRRQSDNTWKLIKGLDPAVVKAVKAELRQTMVAGPAPVTVTPLPVPTAPAAPEPAAFWPGEPAAPVAPTPTAPPTYGAMCEWMVAKVSSGAFTKDHVKEAFATVGLPTIPSLENREDLIPQIYQALCAVEAAGAAA